MTQPLRTIVPPATAFRKLREGITGQRVLIRIWQDTDTHPLFECIDRSRQHLRAWMDWIDRHQTPGDTQEYITRSLLEFTRRDNIGLGIFDKRDNHTILGGTGFHDINWVVPSVEIGYWAAVDKAGNGYITEAVAVLTDFAFREFAAERIAIHCDPRNERSRAVAERCGYVLEGQLRNHQRTGNGGLRDTLIFSRIPDDGQQKTGE
ncbi:MAG: GNAT family N-acetyltransferase [Chloroflexota bacterium]|nr:GNAT family N-acetyltransferase [Chloroflexota bacterium]